MVDLYIHNNLDKHSGIIVDLQNQSIMQTLLNNYKSEGVSVEYVGRGKYLGGGGTPLSLTT